MAKNYRKFSAHTDWKPVYKDLAVAADELVKAVGGYGNFKAWGQKQNADISAAFLKMERTLYQLK